MGQPLYQIPTAKRIKILTDMRTVENLVDRICCVILGCVTKMSAILTYELWTSIQMYGNSLIPTATAGAACFTNDSTHEKIAIHPAKKKSQNRGPPATSHSCSLCAVGTAALSFHSPAIVDLV